MNLNPKVGYLAWLLVPGKAANYCAPELTSIKLIHDLPDRINFRALLRVFAMMLMPFVVGAVNAQTPVPVVTGLSNPGALIVDGGYIYFSEFSGSSGSLSRSLKSGGPREQLRANIAVYDSGNYRGINGIGFSPTHIYYGYGGYNNYRIEELPRGGSTTRLLASPSGGAFMGVVGTNVYYFKSFCCLQQLATTLGATPQQVASGVWPRSMAHDETSFFFVDYYSRNVYRHDAGTVSSLVPLITGNAFEGSIFLDTNNVYLSIGGIVRKASKQGGPLLNITLPFDAVTKAVDDAFIYFTVGNQLWRQSVTGSSAAEIVIDGVSIAGMITDQNFLYWTDGSGGVGNGVIYRLQKTTPPPSPIPPSANPLPPPLVSDATGPITKRNLVMLVHGWNGNPKTWAVPMAQKILARINKAKRDGLIQSSEKWVIGWYDWKDRAATCLVCPKEAFTYAYAEGMHLVAALKQEPNGWDHIHFIAHSAGSNLIQTAATELLTDSTNAKKPNTIHMTFLDAYYPESAPIPYGLGATWSDHYVDTRDNLILTLKNTNRSLPLAYDFNVTNIDPRAIPNAIQWHAWPYLWYGCALDPSIVFDFDQEVSGDRRTCPADYSDSPYGPQLSVEYGDLPLERDGITPQLPTLPYPATGRDANNHDIVCSLTTGNEACPSGDTTKLYSPELTLSAFSQFAFTQANEINVAPTGTVGYLNNAVRMTSGSPVWVQFIQTTTEVFDTIQFDYKFLSSAQGILSVFIDGEMVFLAQEADAGSNNQHTPFIPVGPISPGLHMFALRLDPQTDDQSIAQVSNLQTGVSGFVQYLNQSPLAVANAPFVARMGSLINLDGRASSDPDKLPRPLGFSWKQEAGPSTTLNDWFVGSPTFVAAQAGQYAFTVTVTDGQAFITSNRVLVSVPSLGDIDADGDVDADDLAKINAALNQMASGPNDLRDIDADGKITGLDARKLVLLCTRSRCATK